jgi:hypothetical protein
VLEFIPFTPNPAACTVRSLSDDSHPSQLSPAQFSIMPHIQSKGSLVASDSWMRTSHARPSCWKNHLPQSLLALIKVFSRCGAAGRTRIDYSGRSSSDNLIVAVQAIGELKQFTLAESAFVQALASGDMFDPLIGQILASLFAAACRDGDRTDTLRLLAFECIGILGALDPDRCEFTYKDACGATSPTKASLSNSPFIS